MIPTIIVHGGAKTITEDKVAANHAGCTAAAEAGWAVLISSGTASEAVEAAIRVLEANPTFNASLGATLNSDGEVELDAAIMEGSLSPILSEFLSWNFCVNNRIHKG
ncbi:hypothetical protein WA1_37635 [Scytonema hofmannii PCC 7110]|uniref:Peptidase T n=1 Tax=Scytonema hofmannii PCC 7110 TaxID=128403 RepID=A0A139X041_9CYAN|nr:isoaspartyl peptidase/L-asparaginase [Scytonema hofmannii]KYC38077.1 hypothetical protein WA1_37635 [Scytonema hofmannii PCC 7110]